MKDLFDYFIDGLNKPMTEEELNIFMDMVKKVEQSSGWNSSSTSLQRIASYNCSQMMILTTWKKKTYKFVNIKYMTGATDFGICC